MDDCELIGLAATAAGGKLISSNWVGDLYGFGLERVFWDPLNDDADAFRLAFKLGIRIIWFGTIEEVRRMIVTAAAEIGRSVP